MIVPQFESVWDAFPDHAEYSTMGQLYRYLGGGASAALSWEGFGENGNTCASRISAALNGAGAPIDPAIANVAGATTLRDQNGNHIIFRVRELRQYLLTAYGYPDIDETPPFQDEFYGKKGIILFSVQGWSNATGHAALYNGSNFREDDHDDIAVCDPNVTIVKTEFWRLS